MELRDQLLLELGLSIKQLQDDTRATQQIILDNIDFFKGMGSVSDKLAVILTEAMDKYDIANQLALEQFTKSSEFFKHTISNKYANQNIMQEWFSDFVIEVMLINTPEEMTRDYLKQWMNLKFRQFEASQRKPSSELTYKDRVNFGESLFAKAMLEANMTEYGQFILRTIYIPYTSLYYLEPMLNYPYMSDWIEQMNRFKQEVDKVKYDEIDSIDNE